MGATVLLDPARPRSHRRRDDRENIKGNHLGPGCGCLTGQEKAVTRSPLGFTPESIA